jgi:hypothetical protein
MHSVYGMVVDKKHTGENEHEKVIYKQIGIGFHREVYHA